MVLQPYTAWKHQLIIPYHIQVSLVRPITGKILKRAAWFFPYHRDAQMTHEVSISLC
jgi:hypothetical protein